jgi:hypothetical protein
MFKEVKEFAMRGNMPRRWPVALVLMIGVTSCAAKRPVLYPNAQLSRVGQAAADRDVDDCMQRAREYASSPEGAKARKIAGETAAGAAGGAAIGAVGGAITGSAGEGAAVGAATGGTGGLLHGLWTGTEPDPVFVNFVDQCLRERGYEPIGWR